MKDARTRGTWGMGKLAATILISLAIVTQGHAAIIMFDTPEGALVNDQPVDAQAIFTTDTDQITVVLVNLYADPTSVTQNLSGLSFTVSTGQTAGTLTNSLGVLRTIDGDGNYTDGGAADTGWELSLSDSQLQLNVLGTAVGPAHTIIGPAGSSGLYANANASIAGNNPHNPFLAGSATFELTVPGVTADSTISGVTFSFNTTPGDVVNVPEPAALTLLAVGGLGVLYRRYRGRPRQG